MTRSLHSFTVVLVAAAACGGLSDGSNGDAGDAGDATAPDAPKSANCTATDVGPSSLSALSVKGSGNPALELVPPFSPGTHDYYVRCAQGANEVTVSTGAPPGGTVSMSLSTPGGSLQPLKSNALSVNEGQAIVATATTGTSNQQYWVRCLPHDFPQVQWSLHAKGCSQAPGYYLVGNPYAIHDEHNHDEDVAWAIVLDGHGVPVWYYKESGALIGVYDVDSLSPGTISFIPSPASLPWEIHRLAPFATTGVGAAGPYLDDHELRLLPNGHYLLFSIPIRTGVDLSNLSIPLSDGGAQPPLGTNENIADSVIQEIDVATGKVVWSWDVADHFDPKTACTYPQAGATSWHAPNGRLVYDVFHLNSIDVDPATGNLLVSARNMDSVFYVDRATGKVLWKLGGTPSSKDVGVIYVPIADPFLRQHDARLLPGWSSTTCGGRGQVSVFDDHTDKGNARAVVYDVTVKADSASCATGGATVAWQYEGHGRSSFMGSFRIQPDGSRIIDWGGNTVAGLIFTEVDEKGDDLLDLYFLPSGSSYRAIKVPLDALDLDVMRSTAGAQMKGW